VAECPVRSLASAEDFSILTSQMFDWIRRQTDAELNSYQRARLGALPGWAEPA